MLAFTCPSCQLRFKGKDSSAGRRFQCPTCGSEFRIPAAGGAATLPVVPPAGPTPSSPLELDAIFEEAEQVDPFASDSSRDLEAVSAGGYELLEVELLNAEPAKVERKQGKEPVKPAKPVEKKVENAGISRKLIVPASVSVVAIGLLLAFVIGSGSDDPTSELAPAIDQSIAAGVTPQVAPVPTPTPAPPPNSLPEPSTKEPATNNPEPSKPKAIPLAAPPQPKLAAPAALTKLNRNLPKAIGLAQGGKVVDAIVLCEAAKLHAMAGQIQEARATIDQAAAVLAKVTDKSAVIAGLVAMVDAGFVVLDKELHQTVVNHVIARFKEGNRESGSYIYISKTAIEMARSGDTAGARAFLSEVVPLLPSGDAVGSHIQAHALATVTALGDVKAADAVIRGAASDMNTRDTFRSSMIIPLLTQHRHDEATQLIGMFERDPATAADRLGEALLGACRKGLDHRLMESALSWKEMPAGTLDHISGHALQHLILTGQDIRALQFVEANRLSPKRGVPDYAQLVGAFAKTGRLQEIEKMASKDLDQDKNASGYSSSDIQRIMRGARLLAGYAGWSMVSGDKEGYDDAILQLESLANIEGTGVPPEFNLWMKGTMARAMYLAGETNQARNMLLSKGPEGVWTVNYFKWDDYVLLAAALGSPNHAMARMPPSPASAKPELLRAVALARAETGDIGGALLIADEPTLEFVVKTVAAQYGIDTIEKRIAEWQSLPSLSVARVHLALAAAALDPTPAKLDDPRPRPIDKSAIPAGVVNVRTVKPVETVESLTKMLEDADPDARIRACKLLARAGGDAWPALPALSRLRSSRTTLKPGLAANEAFDTILAAVPSRFIFRKPPPEVFIAVITVMPFRRESFSPEVKCFDALLALADRAAIADAVLPWYLPRMPTIAPDSDPAYKLVPHAGPAAIAAIADKNERLASTAARLLLSIAHHKDVSAALAQVLKNPDASIRKRLLVRMDRFYIQSPPAVASILPLLSDRDPNLRAIAIDRLRIITYSQTPPPLKNLETEVPHLRQAIEALRNDPDFATRRWALEISEFLRLPLRPDGTRAPANRNGFDTRDRPSLAELVNVLRAEQQSEQSKTLALAFLDIKDVPQALTAMAPAWGTFPVAARRTMAEKVSSTAEQLKTARRVLRDLLKDETDYPARQSLQGAMSKLESAEDRELTSVAAPTVPTKIIRPPVKDKPAVNPGGREPFENGGVNDDVSAAAALRHVRTPAAVRVTAIGVLQRSKPNDPQSLQLFQAGLKHRHHSVRSAAAAALGAAAEKSAVKHLIDALDDWADDTRRAVVIALVKIDPDSPEMLAVIGRLITSH